MKLSKIDILPNSQREVYKGEVDKGGTKHRNDETALNTVIKFRCKSFDYYINHFLIDSLWIDASSFSINFIVF